MQNKLFLLVLLLHCSCANVLKHQEDQRHPNEIKFSFPHREYAWREYDRDSVKFARPMPYLTDVYQILYVLNQGEMVLYKTAYCSGCTPTRIFTKAISAQQTRLFRQIMRRVTPYSLASQSNNVWAEDGFQAEVTITKAGKTTKISGIITTCPSW